MKRMSLRVAGTLLVLLLGMGFAAGAKTKTIARCGEGFLEEVDGYRVLHVKGDALRDGLPAGGPAPGRHPRAGPLPVRRQGEGDEGRARRRQAARPQAGHRGIVATQRKYVPERFFEEMRGIADGAGMDVQDIVVANFIPELFHCSGSRSAARRPRTARSTTAAILDYGCDWRLQEHAVLTVAEPRGKIPFVNVTYAGFIGSVTGMNAERISIGEMGGPGLGHWDGVPMAFLVRMALEEADTPRPGRSPSSATTRGPANTTT